MKRVIYILLKALILLSFCLGSAYVTFKLYEFSPNMKFTIAFLGGALALYLSQGLSRLLLSSELKADLKTIKDEMRGK